MNDEKIMRTLSAVAAGAVLALGAAACGDDTGGSASSGSGSGSGSGLSGQIAGAGASSQDAAQQAWIAGFQQANPDVTISYDPVGSGGGREQFAAGGVLFGGTDAAFADEELAAAQDRCGGADNLVQVPAYVSPIAIIYNVDGVDRLQLDSETLAKVFHGDITKWDDPAIEKLNPDADLPGDRITVVHRSDESGTTENFADYLAQTAPDVWDAEVSGDWPVQGQEAAEGTSGVVDAVSNGSGTIGYADASQAGDLAKADVKVGSEYVGPSAEAAAKILEESKEADEPGANSLTFELERTTKSAGTYPIVLVSYEFACTQYDNADDAKVVGAYLEYVTSPEGQQAAAKNAGSAPLSSAIESKVKPIVARIGGQ